MENVFHVINRFRNEVILYYLTLEKRTGKRDQLKRYDEKIDFANLNPTRCVEYKVNKGSLYGLRVYAKAFKRYVILSIWYPRMEEQTSGNCILYGGRCLNTYYRITFQLEFCFRNDKQYAGITNCQSTDFRKLTFHFNASLIAVNLAKVACKRQRITYPHPRASRSCTRLICLNKLFVCLT